MDNVRKLDVIVRGVDRGEYSTYVMAHPRADGRYEGMLEFRPQSGGEPLSTGVQTTQGTVDDVFRWSAGLSVTHIEDSFGALMNPMKPGKPGYSALPTPPAAHDRVEQVRQIERDILSIFQTRGTTRLRTQDVFDRGPHANSDFVRAFEDLEKRWRYLVRHTKDGVDWLDLTPHGARVAGLSESRATTLPTDPPKPTG